MKHIKKRFVFQQENVGAVFAPDGTATIDVAEGIDQRTLGKYSGKKGKNYRVFLSTTEDYLIGGNVHTIHGKHYVIPIPDMTLVYFNMAQQFSRLAEENRKDLLKKLNPSESIAESVMNEIYRLFGHHSAAIIGLFNSLEATINSLIPSNYNYVQSNAKRTESMNRDQIMQYIDFSTKAKKILPEIHGSDFFKMNKPKAAMIDSLKSHRNEIVHTKPIGDAFYYEHLVDEALKFNYNNHLLAARQFINFYKPDHVVDCDCGEDF